LISASFAKLFRFLLNRSVLRQRTRLAYEVHQLALLDRGSDSPQTKVEMDVLRQVDCLVTTTEPLRQLLSQHFPQKPIHNLRLACGFSPDDFPRSEAGEGPSGKKEFTLAYIGSIYREQGVEWLMGQWPRIQKRLPLPARLEIAGGRPSDVEKLRHLAKSTGSGMISVHGAIPPRDLSRFLTCVDALIIPTLAEGRMPYVAITKAYDYPGLNRPIVASNLPSISSVLRHDQEALLFNPGEADACAAALASLLDRPELGSRLVNASRQLALKLSWKARAEEYLQVLK
jgi:glycosyltransferase involved in cell wall biosynthesis